MKSVIHPISRGGLTGLMVLATGVLAVGCAQTKAPAPKAAGQATQAGEAAAKKTAESAKEPKAEAPDPATLPPPPQASGYRSYAPDERPSEEACKQACKHILALAVADVPERVRQPASEYAAKVVDTACPDNCVRTGTRASVACTNAAKTYLEASACPQP